MNDRILETYALALKLSAIKSKKFYNIEIVDLAVDVALEYRYHVDKPGMSLSTCMNRALLFKIYKKIQENKCHTKIHKNDMEERLAEGSIAFVKNKSDMVNLEHVEQDCTLHFAGLSSKATILLKHLRTLNNASQWECYKVLKKRGWSWDVFQSAVKELKDKYVAKI